MEENPAFRSSKVSRLPAPSMSMSIGAGGAGLTEWSESQHNARIASTANSLSALKNLKREIPQPASQSDPKRKPLSDRALEYPSKPTSHVPAAAGVRSNMRPQSLAGMSSGLKQPSATQSRYGASSNVFSRNQAARNGAPTATSRINGVNGVNGVNGRPGHARSKSQAPRPRTAHALREEDRYEAPTNNGTTTLSQDTSQPITTLSCDKIRTSQSFATLPTIRDSSLTSRFLEMSLDDNIPHGSQAISRPLTRQSSQSSTTSHISNIPCKRHGRDDQSNMSASTSRQILSERP